MKMWHGRVVMSGLLQVLGLSFLLSIACAQDVAPSETSPAQKPSAPEITIQSPVQNQKVTAPKLLVKGEVKDDNEVVSIIIGDVSLGVSGSKIPFQYPVYLKKGKNDIHIEALDNEGNKSVQVLTVYCEGCTEKNEKKNTIVPVSPVKQDKKVDAKSKKDKGITAIPDLPSKGVIVKKEDYVEITPTSTSNIVVVPEKKDVKKVAVVVKKKSPVKAKAYAVKKTVRKKARRAHPYAAYVSITPRLLVNDRSVYVTIKPVIKKGRTYAALEQDFVKKLGATAVHDRRGGKQFVYLLVKGHTVRFQAGAITAQVDGKTVYMDSPLLVRDGHVMVPFRTLCESLGFYVHWDKTTRTASAFQH